MPTWTQQPEPCRHETLKDRTQEEFSCLQEMWKERSLSQRLLLQAIQSAAGKLAILAAGSLVYKSIKNVQQTQTDIFVSSILVGSTVAYKISTLINNVFCLRHRGSSNHSSQRNMGKYKNA